MSHLKSWFTFPVRLPHNRNEICSVIYQDVICLTLTQASYSSVRGSLPWTEWCNRDSLDTRGQPLEDRLTCLLYSFCSGWTLSVKIGEQQDRGKLKVFVAAISQSHSECNLHYFGWMIFYNSQFQIDLLTIHRVLCVSLLISVGSRLRCILCPIFEVWSWAGTWSHCSNVEWCFTNAVNTALSLNKTSLILQLPADKTITWHYEREHTCDCSDLHPYDCACNQGRDAALLSCPMRALEAAMPTGPRFKVVEEEEAGSVQLSLS